MVSWKFKEQDAVYLIQNIICLNKSYIVILIEWLPCLIIWYLHNMKYFIRVVCVNTVHTPGYNSKNIF